MGLKRVSSFGKVLVLFHLLMLLNASQDVNIWNYEITKKNLLSFEYNGAFISLWKDTRNLTMSRYYVTPLTELLPNSAKCEQNFLIDKYQVTFDLLLWKQELADAAVLALKNRLLKTALPSQIYPLPIYKMRLSFLNPQTSSQLELDSSWKPNLKERKRQHFHFFTPDNNTCHRLAAQMRSNPRILAQSLRLDIQLTAEKRASRTLRIKGSQVAKSRMFAELKAMPSARGSNDRFLQVHDLNKLAQDMIQTVIAEEITTGAYIASEDQITLKDLLLRSLDATTIPADTLEKHQWNSVFWDPAYARPDKVVKFLSDELHYDEGKKEYTKKSSRSGSGSGGLNVFEVFKFDASGKKSKTAESKDLHEWLIKNNLKIEIEGEIFKVKPVALKRINVFQLEHQQNILTTSVQIRSYNVENSIALTVGQHVEPETGVDPDFIRAKFREIEKENEALKRRNNDLQKTLNQQIRNVTSELGAELRQLEWIKNKKYCILKKGDCPPGFDSISTYQDAISAWSTGTVNGYTYAKYARFGDSFLEHHSGKLFDMRFFFCCKK